MLKVSSHYRTQRYNNHQHYFFRAINMPMTVSSRHFLTEERQKQCQSMCT